MTEAPVQRRLAAIMATDVVGYSRLMGRDEAGTLSTLRQRHHAIVEPLVERHHGRVVKLMGDGVLAEFGSAVDAVNCALAMQEAYATANDGLPEPDRMVLRIGINLGDVIVEADDIYGDGVNIAARLETAAPQAGILISEAVHAQIRGKVDADFSDAGDLALKNIATPVRAWRWGGGAAGLAPGTVELGHSIAVLPFNNMSGAADQDYFSDGITEDVITDLSKIPGLMVVARNSSFAYKGKSPDIRTVGRELGVASVLEGSVRRAGNRVRITAQLIDAVTGGHLWAERYDRDLTDIFEVQDEVTRQIVSILKVKLMAREAAIPAQGRTQNMEAYDACLRGRELVVALTKGDGDPGETMQNAVAAMQEAITLDPGYALPYAMLSLLHVLDYQNHWSGKDMPLQLAVDYADKAVATDPEEPFGHYAKSVSCTFTRDLACGKAAAERAVALNPNFSNAYAAMGTIEIYRGNPQGAIAYFEIAMRLDPVFKAQTLHFLGLAQLMSGDFETAVGTLRDRIALVPTTDISRGYLISALGHLGRRDEAQSVWQDLQRVHPAYSLTAHLARLPWQNPEQEAHIRKGFEMAGVAF